MKKLMLCAVLLLILGCADTAVDPGSDAVEFTFRVLNSVGHEVRTIEHGRPIHFEFVITNNTDKDITVRTTPGHPAASFSLQSEDRGLGVVDRLDSRVPRDSIFVLGPNEHLRQTAAWSLHPWNAPPPVGEYTAYAFLNSFVEQWGTTGTWSQKLTIAPPEAGATEVFAWYRTPAFSFCPPADRIYWASVIRYGDGRHVLQGTTTFDNSLLTMPCGPPDYCIWQQPFEDVVLTQDQEDVLYDLLNSFPEEEHIIDGACDPCLVDYYYIRDRVEEINPCASGSELFWMKAADIDTFLHTVVGIE